MPSIYVFNTSEGLRQLHGVEETQAALNAETTRCLWVNIREREPVADSILSEVFGFHPLAIEDVYKDQHRPKVEDYDEYLYLIGRAFQDTDDLARVETIELDLFLGKNFVVTHHPIDLPCVTWLLDSEEALARLMERGPVFLAHGMIDRLVDGFLPLAEAYVEEIDHLEAAVLEGEDRLARIVELKGGIQRLRRTVVAQRNVLAKLARAEFDEIPAEAKPFFRDVHEHMVQFTDALDDQREELHSVFDAFHSLSAHRMNEIIKVLTLISTVMLPLTFLVGLYGMNFKFMPELEWKYGYPMAWVVMLAIAGLLFGFFRRRNWL